MKKHEHEKEEFMERSSRLLTGNRLHAGLAVLLVAGLGISAVFPVNSQDITFGDPVDTDYAPYALGQAGPDIAQSFDGPTALEGAARTDTIVFSVGGLVENYGQAEYKVTMAEGDTLNYSWRATDDIYYEFHGHYMLDPETPGDAVLYRNEAASGSHGSVTAALEGWHGWYFVNDSFDEPVEIELTLWGDYELTPGVRNTR